MGRVEPAALGERGAEHPLKRGRGAHHQVLRLPEPPRVGDRGDRGVELGVGVGPVGHWVAIIRAWPFR